MVSIASRVHRVPLVILLLINVIILSCTSNIGLAVVSAADPKSGTTRNPTTTTNKKTNKGVIKLDSRNFDSSLKDGKVWLIEFYAPW